MENKTPLRLVAFGAEDDDEDVTFVQEFPPGEDTAPGQDATPVRSTPEHEAITRKVPAAANAAQVVAPEPPKRIRTWRRFVPAAVALVPVVVVLATRITSKPAPAPASRSAASPSLGQVPQASPAQVPAPVPIAVPQAKAAPEVIRLEITAEPVGAELSLDGNVLAGHRLNLEVPRDRGIHVVSASAPGYFPFNQQVSFSDDVILHINLRRAHAPVVRQAPHPHPSRVERVEAKPQISGRSPSVQQAPGVEPGMDLVGPTTRHSAKTIDERNPYKP